MFDKSGRHYFAEILHPIFTVAVGATMAGQAEGNEIVEIVVVFVVINMMYVMMATVLSLRTSRDLTYVLVSCPNPFFESVPSFSIWAQ